MTIRRRTLSDRRFVAFAAAALIAWFAGSVRAAAALGFAGGLHYVRLLGEYWYIWRTERTYAGTCRQFTLTLADGTTHTALFRFVR